MNNLTLQPSQLDSQRVMIRANLDVPLKNGEVQDTTRLETLIASYRAVSQHAHQCIIIGHAGRPEGIYHRKYSLEPLVKPLTKILGCDITFVPYSYMFTQPLPPNDVVLLDNVRFFPGEEAASKDFAQKLADLADAYVVESFATAHRDHASMTVVPKLMPSYLGLHFQSEIRMLDQVLKAPKKPLVLVLGGAKLDTKEPLIQAFKDKADYILVGGKIASDITHHPEYQFPNVYVAKLIPDGKDISIESARQFADIIQKAGTLIWNGTMGIFEDPQYQQGTRIVAESIRQTSAVTIVGGGDTEAAITVLDIEASIDHISSGGGAMLTYLSTGKLIAMDV